MVKKLMLGTLLGGVAAFVWSSLWWMAFPFAESAMRPFTDEDAVASLVVEHAPESGLYVFPQAGGNEEQAMEKMQAGPFILAVVTREGVSSMAAPMVLQLITVMLGAGLFTWLLLQTNGLSFWGRATFVATAALTAAVICRLPDMNWWGFPGSYTAAAFADLVIGWFLVGLILAKITAEPVVAGSKVTEGSELVA